MVSNNCLLSVRRIIKGGEASATCRDRGTGVVTAGSDQQKYAERSKNGVITGPPLKAVEVVATTTTAGWPKMASPSPSVSGEVPESLQDRWHNSNDSGCCEAIEFCQDSGADSVSLM